MRPDQFTQNDVVVIKNEQRYQGFFRMTGYTLKHRLFDGNWSQELDRECFDQGDSVAVILYDPQNDMILLGSQFRVGALRDEQPWLLEVVAGRMDSDETPQEVAHRESIEEMQTPIKKLIPLFDFYSSPGGSNEKVHYFCGLIDPVQEMRVCGLKEEHEDILVAPYTLQTALEMVENNQIHDGIAIIGIQWLALNKHRF